MVIYGHQFIVDGEKTYDSRGKSHCPDSLDIVIQREKVLSLIEQLARLLDVSQDAVILINVMGELVYREEEVHL